MFVNIVKFPAIKKGKEREFREWFFWSNDLYAGFPGFISRRLLKSTSTGGYAAVVEHESEETFMAMHASERRVEAWKRVQPLLEGKPQPDFYEMVSAIERR